MNKISFGQDFVGALLRLLRGMRLFSGAPRHRPTIDFIFFVGEARFLRSKFAMERSGICSASRFYARYAFVFREEQAPPLPVDCLFSVLH